MKSKATLINSFLTLFFGGIIYILFRESHLKMFSWMNYLGLKNTITFIRNLVKNFELYDWILFSLPDGLWLFSYMSVTLYIWKGKISLSNIFWILFIPLIAISSEIGQYFQIIPGTFDSIDIIMYLLGAIFPYIVYKKSITINLRHT